MESVQLSALILQRPGRQGLAHSTFLPVQKYCPFSSVQEVCGRSNKVRLAHLHELADLLKQHVNHGVFAAIKCFIMMGIGRWRLLLEYKLRQGRLALCMSTGSLLTAPTILGRLCITLTLYKMIEGDSTEKQKSTRCRC